MTAILISRALCEGQDTLYLVADQRVTSDDTIISDHNQKIFSFGPTATRPHGRHYVTVGEVSPTDYLLHKLEAITGMDALYELVMESEVLTKMPSQATIYVIDDIKGAPEILIIDKFRDYAGTRKVSMEEMKYSPLFDGSGGTYVHVALTALKDLLIPDFTYEDRIKLAFHAAAKSISSMNDRVTIIKLPISPIIKKRKK